MYPKLSYICNSTQTSRLNLNPWNVHKMFILSTSDYKSQESIVSIGTGYELDDREVTV
jgi:hypothetical protein